MEEEVDSGKAVDTPKKIIICDRKRVTRDYLLLLASQLKKGTILKASHFGIAGNGSLKACHFLRCATKRFRIGSNHVILILCGDAAARLRRWRTAELQTTSLATFQHLFGEVACRSNHSSDLSV